LFPPLFSTLPFLLCIQDGKELANPGFEVKLV